MDKAVFLDRDGVINIEKNYIYKIEDFVFIDYVFEVLRELQKRNFILIIVTNQAGIGRGYYSEEDFSKLNRWMLDEFLKEGIIINAVYYDPTHPVHGIGSYRTDSFNRKPNPGMILQAKNDFNIDLENSILIGDKESDIQAGINAGIGRNILIKTGHVVDTKITKASIVIENLKELLLLI